MPKKPTKKRADESNPFSKKSMLKKTVWTPAEYKAYTGKEADLQRQVEQYLDVTQVDYIRLPDELYKILFSNQYRIVHCHTGADVTGRVRGYLSSYIKGISDLIIMEPIGKLPFFIGATLELKVKNRKASKHQERKFKNIPLVVEQSFEGATAFIRKLKEFAGALTKELDKQP